MDCDDPTIKKEIIFLNHLEKSQIFINNIAELIGRFQWEFNTKDTRNQICYNLKSLFDSTFDEYWQEVSGLNPNDLTFVDLSTIDLIDQNTYQIGVSILGCEPIPFSDFITEHFGIVSVRDRKIREVLD